MKCVCGRKRETRGGGASEERKRKHHGKIIQTLLNLSKAIIFCKPQSAIRTAVNKEKVKNSKRIISSRDMETKSKAPLQATEIQREGRMWSVERFHLVFVHIISILQFYFWSRPDPMTYAYEHKEMSIIYGSRMKH